MDNDEKLGFVALAIMVIFVVAAMVVDLVLSFASLD